MDSDIQDVCQKIYKNHKRALDLIFEYRPDTQLKIKEILLGILNGKSLIIDKSVKTFIRFTSTNIDHVVPKEGNGWTDSKRILLFEFQNTTKSLDLCLIIGTGEEKLREKLHSMALSNNDVFPHVKKSPSKWDVIWKSSVLKWKSPIAQEKNIDDMDNDELTKKLNNFINNFLKIDLPKIEKAILSTFDSSVDDN